MLKLSSSISARLLFRYEQKVGKEHLFTSDALFGSSSVRGHWAELFSLYNGLY